MHLFSKLFSQVEGIVLTLNCSVLSEEAADGAAFMCPSQNYSTALPKVEYKADVPPISLRVHINNLVKLLGFFFFFLLSPFLTHHPPKDTASLDFMPPMGPF